MSEEFKRNKLPFAARMANMGIRAVVKGGGMVAKAGFNAAVSANDERLRKSALHEVQLIMFGRDIVEGEQGLPPILPSACAPGSPELALFKERCNWLTRHNALPDYARRFARTRNITLTN